VFLLLYGLSYGAVSIVRKGWMRRIRRVNVVMAWAVIVGAALWMTPVLNAYQIATSCQVARFQSGQSTLAELALWQMAHDWGKPGRRGLEQLETMTDRADHAELVARIETVRDQINPFQFEQAIARRTAPDRAGALASLLAVRPTGAALPIAALAELPSFRLDQWLAGCRRTLPDGRPGCVLVKGPFVPATGSDAQGIVLYLDADGLVKANHVQLESDGRISVREVFDPVADQWPTMQPKVIEDALDGDFVIRPSGDHALFLDGAVLVPGN
jgi:hypothetical protein